MKVSIEESKLYMGDIVRVIDENYESGLYEVVEECNSSNRPESFDYDYFITNDEANTDVMVKREYLVLVCRANDRKDKILRRESGMSKDRLGFDVKKEMKHLKKIVNKSDSLTISSRFVKYLIEQTERVQEMENEIERLKDIYYQCKEWGEKESFRCMNLEQQNKRYREAIEFGIEYLKNSDIRQVQLVVTALKSALEGEEK